MPEGYLTGCSFNYLSDDFTTKIFILAFFIGAWVVPLSIIVYSYTSIIRAVAQSRRAVSQRASERSVSAGIYIYYTIYRPYVAISYIASTLKDVNVSETTSISLP